MISFSFLVIQFDYDISNLVTLVQFLYITYDVLSSINLILKDFSMSFKNWTIY
jgi:hypothetical protein